MGSYVSAINGSKTYMGSYDVTNEEDYVRAKKLRKIKKKNTVLQIRSHSENGAVSSSLRGCNRRLTQFSIIHFNDVYEARSDTGTKSPGAARFSYDVDKEAKELKALNNGTPPLTFFSGDILNPSVLSRIDKGCHMADVLNRTRVDVSCFGNHEFDFKEDDLRKFTDKTHCPWVVTNVVLKRTQQPLCDALDSVVIDYAPNLRIGIIGLVEEDWLGQLTAFNKEDLVYTDFIECARDHCENMIQHLNCNFIIALTHMRWNNDERLQRQVPEIDLILGGHDHEYGIRARKSQSGKDKMPLIIKSGSDFQSYSVIQVFLSENGLADVKAEKKVVPCEGPKDEYLVKNIAVLEAEAAATWKKPLVRIDRQIDTTFMTIRTKEACIGNFVAKFIREISDADIGLINSGTFRADHTYKKGHLYTEGDIYRIFPLLDRIVVFEASGEVLLQLLNNSVSRLPNRDGRFMQICGLRFKYDITSRPQNDRVIPSSVFVERAGEENTPLDLCKVYTVATKAFIKDGKDGYDCLRNCKELYDREDQRCKILSTALIDYFEQLQHKVSTDTNRKIPVVEMTPIEGRIKEVGIRPNVD